MKRLKKQFTELSSVVTDEDFKTYVGPNAYKFAKAKAKSAEGKMTSWSWAACLLGPLWPGYYKWWTGVIMYCAMALFLPLEGVMAMFIFFGSMGKGMYVVRTYAHIKKIKEYESDPKQLHESLKAAGGTSYFVACLALIAVIGAIILRLYLI